MGVRAISINRTTWLGAPSPAPVSQPSANAHRLAIDRIEIRRMKISYARPRIERWSPFVTRSVLTAIERVGRASARACRSVRLLVEPIPGGGRGLGECRI